MKFYLFILFNIVSLTSYPQEHAFFGTVTGKNGIGIPYCIVQVKDSKLGVYSDHMGRFYFKGDPDSVKALIFYSIGYEKKEIALKDFSTDSVIVVLKDNNIQLNEVAVSSAKAKIKTGILGKKNITNKLFRCNNCERPWIKGRKYGRYGDEWGIFLKADSARNGVLKEIFVYVTDEGIPDTKFRIHVYEADSLTWMPTRDVTDSNVIVHANKGNEWVRIDLSSKRISVKVGLTISVEWISEYGNRNAWLRDGTDSLNGQVMGATYDYWRSGYITGYHNVFKDKWNFTILPGKKRETLNLMAYATYTYLKE